MRRTREKRRKGGVGLDECGGEGRVREGIGERLDTVRMGVIRKYYVTERLSSSFPDASHLAELDTNK